MNSMSIRTILASPRGSDILDLSPEELKLLEDYTLTDEQLAMIFKNVPTNLLKNEVTRREVLQQKQRNQLDRLKMDAAKLNASLKDVEDSIRSLEQAAKWSEV